MGSSMAVPRTGTQTSQKARGAPGVGLTPSSTCLIMSSQQQLQVGVAMLDEEIRDFNSTFPSHCASQGRVKGAVIMPCVSRSSLNSEVSLDKTSFLGEATTDEIS